MSEKTEKPENMLVEKKIYGIDIEIFFPEANSLSDAYDLTRMMFTRLDGFSFDDMVGHKKYKVLNNCVNSELGRHIWDCAFGMEQQTLEAWWR